MSPSARDASRMPLTGVYLPALILICTLSLLFPGTATAAGTLTLEAAERLALDRDDSLARLNALAEAEHERGIADGALPDPELMLGYRNLPVDSFSTTQDDMTMLEVAVRQRFPAGRSRQLLRERSDFTAQALRAERKQRALEIRREVRRLWLEWNTAREAVTLTQAAETELGALADIVERRVASGSARNVDLAELRLEHAALREAIIQYQSEAEAAIASLTRWIGTQSADDMDDTRPQWPAPQHDRIRDGLAQHPELAVPALRIAAAGKDTALAQQAFRPEWGVELGYGMRRARAMDDGRAPDMLSGMVSLSLPLFTGDRQDRRLAAAQRKEHAAEHERSDRLRALDAGLRSQFSIWQRYEELATLYREQLLRLADDSAEIAQSAYRAERASLDQLIRARVGAVNYRNRQLQALQRRDMARIELLYLAGE